MERAQRTICIPQTLRESPKECTNGKGGAEMVVGVGFEPTNARSGRIYSPHPLATWIPYQRKKIEY